MKSVYPRFGLVLAALAIALPAQAETIVITSGALEWIRPSATASVSLAGESFVFTGRTGQGVFTPRDSCGGCPTGSTVDLTATWVGLDLMGTASYNGITYTQVGAVMSDTAVGGRWTGTLLIPNSFAGGALTAPFQFTGTFRNPTAIPLLELVGTGQATANLVPSLVAPGGFNLESIRYEFDSAAPVPEPTSMLLIGTGLAGLAARRRRPRLSSEAEG